LEDRELRALALFAEGWTYADVSTKTGMTESVVKNLLVNIRRKIGAANLHHAVAIALREKIIE
jgi:DNA-binding CsgD family transcriptional regulator